MGQDLQSLAIFCDWPWVNPILFGCLARSVISYPMYLGRKRVTHIGKFPPLALPSRWLARRVVFVCFHHGMSTPPRFTGGLVTSSFTVTARGLRCSETSNNSTRMKKNRSDTNQILINPISVLDVEHNTNFDVGFFVLKASTVLKFVVLFNLRT